MPIAAIDKLEPFKINVLDEQIFDLKRRLKETRWPADIGNEDWFYGVNVAYLKDLVDYWIEGFDWRAVERRINSYQQFRVVIDDVPVHFVYKAGKDPKSIPIILSHGFPWSFWDWCKTIDPLADPEAYGGSAEDSFDILVPSLPGFGFSTPLLKPDTNFWKIADVYHKLMTEVLELPRYAAGGSDMGSLVTGQLGHKYASSLYGIYLAKGLRLDFFSGERPWDVTAGKMVPEGVSEDVRKQIIAVQRRFASHVAAQMLDSETLSFSLTDSPVGMLAWLLARWRNWSDSHGDVESVFPRDHILTNAMIYWTNSAARSSMRTYANAARYPWKPSHDRKPPVEAPTGMSFLGFENPPGVTTENRVAAFEKSPEAGWFNSVYLKAHEHGGHFAAYENPEAIISDLRATFRPLRPRD